MAARVATLAEWNVDLETYHRGNRQLEVELREETMRGNRRPGSFRVRRVPKGPGARGSGRGLLVASCAVLWTVVLPWALLAASEPRLVLAAKERDEAALRTLLDAGAEVDQAQGDGATALHWAVYWDEPELAQLLLEAGADAAAANDLGVTPLLLACNNGSATLVEMLLETGADVDARPASGETPLMACARSGSVPAVRSLLGHGAQVDVAHEGSGQSALMWAAAAEHPEVVRQLVERGASTSQASKGGFTPLHFAARQGDARTAELLLAAGAPVDAEASDGSRPLLVATLRGHVDVALRLLEAGADPNASTTGYTALHWAAGSWETEMTGPVGVVVPEGHEWSAMAGLESRKVELVRALLEHGADPNVRLEKQPPRVGYFVFSRRPKGATPYYLAAKASDAEVMALLVEHGADPLLGTENGMTPLLTAAGVRWAQAEVRVTESRALAAVSLAVAHGADVNAADAIGETALHGAARIRADSVVQFLVDQGAKVNVRNARGQTPLFIAERFFHPGSVPLTERSSTGDLLRKLAVAEVAPETLDQWDALTPEERSRLEEQHLAQVDPSALGRGITDEMNENPMLPRRKKSGE